MKKKLTKDGFYIMTEDRRSQTYIEISIPELKEIIKHAEKMAAMRSSDRLPFCMKHLSPDVTFVIRFKPKTKLARRSGGGSD